MITPVYHSVLVAIVLLMVAWAPGCGGASEESATESEPATRAANASVTFQAADGHSAELKVEVARTGPEKARGLMKREVLESDSGMIFVWDSPTQGGFWMKDTYIPLSIAFISQDGAIVDIQDMQPLDLSNHVPAAPYIYAVEANQGWFAEHGVRTGDRALLQD